MKLKNLNSLDILRIAKDLGVELFVENDQLKYRSHKDKLSSELRESILEFKEILISILKNDSILKDYKTINSVIINKSKPVAASSMQRQLYFLQKLYPNTFHYNIPFAIEWEGKFKTDFFLQAFDQVVNSHEILRTHFTERNGLVQQIINEKIKYSLEVVDLKNLSEQDMSEVLENLVLQTSCKIFELTSLPLFKASIVLCENNKVFFLFCIHHILFDGESIYKMMLELERNYNYLVKNNFAFKPKKEPLQFADYIAWRESVVKILDDSAQFEYWRKKLKNLPRQLLLPIDKKPLANMTYLGDLFSIKIEKEIIDKIKYYISEKKISTLFTFFLAAYFVLLKRYCEQDDFIIGVPFADRKLDDFEETLGIFINSVPIRHQFFPEETFDVTLQKIAETISEAHENHNITFDKLFKELAIEETNQNPVFQTMFFVEEDIAKNMNFFGLKSNHKKINNKTSKFDISLSIEQLENYICHFEYNTEVFSDSTIQRMANHYLQIIEGLLLNLNQSIDKLVFLKKNELNFLINELNKTESPFQKNKPIHLLFVESASSYPNEIAVSDHEKTWTYNILNTKANQLSAYLQSLNNESQPRIAVLMDRCNEVILAWLAILKIGGAFVPIDPEYPLPRINHILQDAGVRFCITKKTFIRDRIFNQHTQFICLDEINLNSYDAINPVNPINMDDLAYIIYTSGSTGKPKGVMIHHLAISHYIQWAIQKYGCDKGSGAPVHSSLAFDLTLTSILGSLCCGKRVFLVNESLGFEGLMTHLENRQDYSIIKLTPAHLKLLQQQLSSELLGKLFATIIVGGEALYYQDLSFWHINAPNARFINEYGPTEITVANTIFELSRKLPDTESIPIGRSIDNSQIWVLDKFLNPQPIGVAGEIYLGGIGLAKGYLGQPELTEQKFIENPFKQFSNEKIYKTGDLGKVLANGNIEYLGRLDSQVKIKGYRIELDEIKSFLEVNISIKQSAITVKTNEHGNHCIVAYLVARDNNLSIASLRREIQENLPSYMMPSYFIFMEEIPLTVNGKINYQILPEPTAKNLLLEYEYCSPKNNEEKILTQIWCNVLKIEKISRTDNFFSLGGDSIACIQIIAKAREAGLELRTKQLFTHQTIAELALVAAESKPNDGKFNDLIDGDIPLTPIQSWFFSLQLNNINHFNQAFLFKTELNLNVIQLANALDICMSIFNTFKIRFAKEDNQWRQLYSDLSGHYVLHEFDFTGSQELFYKKSENCFNQLQSQLDITKGPIMRVALISGHPDKLKRLFICIHHLFIDGISWRILIDTLWKAYYSEKLTIDTISYKSWSNALNASYEKFYCEIDYWASIKSDSANFPISSPFSELPLQKYFHEKNFSLNKSLTDILLKKGNIAYQTNTSDLLITALLLSLFLLTKQTKLIFKFEGHGREDSVSYIDISKTIGWFTNIYPVILEIDSAVFKNNEIDFYNLITQIKDQLRKIPNKGIGYGVLQYLSVNSSPVNLISLNEIYLTFNYLGQFDADFNESQLIESNESVGRSISSNNSNGSLITFNCWVTNHQANFNVIYSKKHFKKIFIEKFSNRYKQSLEEILTHLMEKKTITHTISDFHSVSLSQIELDNLQLKNTIEDIYSLTPLQRDMLSHHLKINDCDAYFTQIKWRYKGDINAQDFRSAWQSVVDFLPILRTQFFHSQYSSQSMQVVYANIPLDWQEFNFDGEDLLTADKRVNELLNTDFKQGFNVLIGNRMRIYLINLPENNKLLIWSHHHIMLDGWSIPLVFSLLNSYYLKLTHHDTAAIKLELPSFKSYINWLNEKNRRITLDYWRKKLNSFKKTENIFNLSTDLFCNNRSVNKISHIFAPIEQYQLENFSKQKHITLNILCQLAWAIVLAIKSKHSDILYSIITSGRLPEFPNSNEVIGLCANILPVRVQFSVEQIFEEIMQSLQIDMQEINDYINMSQNEIFDELFPLSSISLSDSLFVFENFPFESQKDVTGFSFSLKNLDFTIKMNYPINIVFLLKEKKLAVDLVYDEKIAAEVAKDLLSCLTRVLFTICNNSSAKISQFFPEIYRDKPILQKPRVEKNLIFKYQGAASDSNWFFIHPSGCGAEAYAPLAAKFPSDMALYAVDSYHLQVSCDVFNSIEELAYYYWEQIIKIQPVGPYCLGGWSMGGILALEIAQIFIRTGQNISHLVIFDSFVRSIEDLKHSQFAQNHYENMLISSQYYQNLDIEMQKKVLLAVNKELKMLENYQPQKYLGKVSLFKAMSLPSNDQNNINNDFLEFLNTLLRKPDNGWNQIASYLKIYPLYTNHWQIFSNDQWPIINQVLKEV